MEQVISICRECALFNGSLFYLAYGLIVLLASVTRFRQSSQAVATAPVGEDKKPPLAGELGELFSLRASISTQLVAALLAVGSFDFFRAMVQRVVAFIRFVFLMGDKPSFLVSLRRYLVFYYLAIPLPAAFLAPVLHEQRKPDFHLLIAVVLLIFVNALGDVISVRLTLRNFENITYRDAAPLNDPTAQFWQSIKNEAIYYLSVARGTAYSLGVLIGVLILSSILYGVQIGEFDFGFSADFFTGAWDRVLRFPELAFTPYWFRDQTAPFPSGGIPGLFLYGVVSFIPIIILFGLAVVWLILLPLRIAVTLPVGRAQRLVASEFAVIVLCIVVSHALKINVLKVYSFLTPT
jgi:hypothetical protein